MRDSQDNTIKHDTIKIKSAAKVITDYIRRAKTQVSVNDIQHNTGLATHIIDQSLNVLIKTYYCTADFDTDSVLYYSFDMCIHIFQRLANPILKISGKRNKKLYFTTVWVRWYMMIMERSAIVLKISMMISI